MDTYFLFAPDFLMFGPIGMNQKESMPVLHLSRLKSTSLNFIGSLCLRVAQCSLRVRIFACLEFWSDSIRH